MKSDEMKVTAEQMDRLRACLNRIYDVCDELDQAETSVEVSGMKLSVRKLFEIEATAYLLYLTVSDNIVDEEEIRVINSVMGRTYSLEECLKMVDIFGMRNPEFGKSTPASFKLLSDHTRRQGADIADTLIVFYEVLGTVLLAADDTLAEREAQAQKSYIHLLRGYKALNES